MAANLLAADTEGLFACGIAQSGAYNRTLTPFGFQSEQRTLWEAPEIYHTMSPFLQVEGWPVEVRSSYGTCKVTCLDVSKIVTSGGESF